MRTLVVWLAGLLFVACDEAPTPPAPQKSAPDVGAVLVPAKDAAVTPVAKLPGPIATCGDLVLTMKDYDDALEHMRVYRPIAPEVLGSPRFQQGTVMNLVDIRLMRAAALERGVQPTPEEIAAEIAGDPRLAKADVTRARLIAADAVLNRKLTQALVQEPSETELWTAWKARTERLEMEFVAVPNTPSSAAITKFVDTRGGEIEKFFAENPARFRLPATRRARILERKGDDARERLATLRVEALAGADFAKLAKAHSTHPSAKVGGNLGWVVKRQQPEAFQVEVGDISEPFTTRGGFAILKVEEALPARPRTLTGSVRREVAADLLRAQGSNPSAAASAARVAEAWRGGELTSALKPLGLRVQKSLPFSPDRDPKEIFVPGIGKAPEVVLAARALNEAKPVSDPVFSAGKHYVLRFVHRGKATRTAFAAEREVFAAQLLALRRRQAVPQLLDRARAACGLELDLTAVARRYGRTEKPRR